MDKTGLQGTEQKPSPTIQGQHGRGVRNSGSKWGMVWYRTGKTALIIDWTLVLLDISVHPDIHGHVWLGLCFLNIRLKYPLHGGFDFSIPMVRSDPWRQHQLVIATLGYHNRECCEPCPVQTS